MQYQTKVSFQAMKSTLSVLCVIAGLLTAVQTQTVNVNCNFSDVAGYTCHLFGAAVEDNPNANFVIGGQHLPGRTDADVRQIMIFNSNIPFIIPQMFTTFPNVEWFVIFNGGLTRVQSNAFADARRLTGVTISSGGTASTFETIEANAFNGASSLLTLDLTDNAITSIHETAFTGLNLLWGLALINNRIHQLDPIILHPLTSLEVLYVQDNLLISIDGRLLANHQRIREVNFSANQINAIARNFLDNLPNLLEFNMLGNICADEFWRIEGTTTVETVREGLQECFNNFVDDDVKHFQLKLHGSLTVRDDEGNEIVTLVDFTK